MVDGWRVAAELLSLLRYRCGGWRLYHLVCWPWIGGGACAALHMHKEGGADPSMCATRTLGR